MLFFSCFSPLNWPRVWIWFCLENPVYFTKCIFIIWKCYPSYKVYFQMITLFSSKKAWKISKIIIQPPPPFVIFAFTRSFCLASWWQLLRCHIYSLGILICCFCTHCLSTIQPTWELDGDSGAIFILFYNRWGTHHSSMTSNGTASNEFASRLGLPIFCLYPFTSRCLCQLDLGAKRVLAFLQKKGHKI